MGLDDSLSSKWDAVGERGGASAQDSEGLVQTSSVLRLSKVG